MNDFNTGGSDRDPLVGPSSMQPAVETDAVADAT
jgi:hypothetical protein